MTLAPAPIPPLVRPRPQPAEAEVGRVLLQGVPWAVYEQLLEVVGDGPARLTYDDGTLEIEMPSDLHELLKGIAGEFVSDYMKEFSIRYLPFGSMTLRREAKRGGLEGDQSYYIQRYREVEGQRIDLSIHPPPDLAIEIDLSPPEVEKASIYGRLGVPEIWQWRDDQLAVLERGITGAYVERSGSIALPGFPLDLLAAELSRSPHDDQAEALWAFRQWCRDRAAERTS